MGPNGGDQLPPLLVDPACFLSLVNSAVEVYNRETTGLLVGAERWRVIGGRRRRVMALEGAYPLQTAARSVTWVEHGNHSAALRARTAVDSLGFRILGEYHSHTNNEQGLSRADVEYARQALRSLNGHAPKRWLELVLGLRRKEYASSRRPGFTWREYARKVGCTVVLSPRTGFDVTIAGYWVTPDGDSGARCVEATVHVPWTARTAA
jgi:proteasome lid subunit RPN8/RPN11